MLAQAQFIQMASSKDTFGRQTETPPAGFPNVDIPRLAFVQDSASSASQRKLEDRFGRKDRLIEKMEAHITSLQSKIERLEDHRQDSSDALLSIKAKAEEVENKRSERDQADQVELDAAVDAIRAVLTSYTRSHMDKKAQDKADLLDLSAEVSRLLPRVMRPSVRQRSVSPQGTGTCLLTEAPSTPEATRVDAKPKGEKETATIPEVSTQADFRSQGTAERLGSTATAQIPIETLRVEPTLSWPSRYSNAKSPFPVGKSSVLAAASKGQGIATVPEPKALLSSSAFSQEKAPHKAGETPPAMASNMDHAQVPGQEPPRSFPNITPGDKPVFKVTQPGMIRSKQTLSVRAPTKRNLFQMSGVEAIAVEPLLTREGTRARWALKEKEEAKAAQQAAKTPSEQSHAEVPRPTKFRRLSSPPSTTQ